MRVSDGSTMHRLTGVVYGKGLIVQKMNRIRARGECCVYLLVVQSCVYYVDVCLLLLFNNNICIYVCYGLNYDVSSLSACLLRAAGLSARMAPARPPCRTRGGALRHAPWIVIIMLAILIILTILIILILILILGPRLADTIKRPTNLQTGQIGGWLQQTPMGKIKDLSNLLKPHQVRESASKPVLVAEKWGLH